MGDPKVIKKITVKNGLTLAEVRRIRKELREIYADNSQEFMNKGELIECFIFSATPQGHNYWMSISQKVDDFWKDEEK